MKFHRKRPLARLTAAFAGVLALLGATAQAQTQFVPGTVKVELFNNIGGGVAVTDLTSNQKYIDNAPDEVRFVKFAEFPNGDDDGAAPPGNVYNNYGLRISGYIIPTETASYVFFLAADDGAEFWLSTDSAPTNAKRVATEPVWNGVRAWSNLDRRDATNPENRTDKYQATQWPGGAGAPIQLTAGQRYYFYGLMKEGGGGDNWAITWTKAGDAEPTNGDLPIGAANLGVDAPTAVTITQEPQDTTVYNGRSATFTAAVSAVPGLSYQWFQGNTLIDGATGLTLRVGPLALADNGKKYKLVATVAGGASTTSREATVTVINPPPEVETPGFLKFEVFENILPRATDIASLEAWPPYVANDPHRILHLTGLDSRSVFPTDALEDYGARVTGWITPTESGNYTFFLTSDDASVLYLSTSASPAQEVLIANEDDCCDGFLEPDLADPATSAPIALVAGQKYYLRALLREGGGGDLIQVAWRKEGDLTPAGRLTPIPPAFLSGNAYPGGTAAFTAGPTNVTVAASTTATFSVAVTNNPASPVLVQWQKNGVYIPGATGLSYTTPQLRPTDNNAKFRAVVSVPGAFATSSEATVTVTADTSNPRITRVSGNETFDSLTVYYSEEVNAAASSLGSYQVAGLTISAITNLQAAPTIVRLTTSKQTVDAAYTMTVNNVSDLSGNPLTPNSKEFRSFRLKPGIARYERYNTTASYADFRSTIVGQVPPDFLGTMPSWEAPVNVAENYGGRLSGFVIPPTSGNYVLYMASDDTGGLYLSTNEDPANIKQIASEPTWNDNRDWVALDRRDATAPENRSDTWAATEWASGATITLTAGTRYYMETLWKEGGGGDNGSTTWKLATAADPADGTATVLTGNLIAWYADPFLDPPTFVQQPTGGGAFSSGDTVAFAAPQVSGGEPPYTYQWQRNRVNVEGATNASLSIPNAGVANVGDYRLVVTTAAGASAISSELRAIMRGAFLIEGEDFNYAGGQSKAEASVMPYLGGAYTNLDAVLNIDYVNTDGLDSNSYRKGANFTAGRNVNNDGPLTGDNSNNLRGEWSVTGNYKIGWVGTGEWMNYTRTFPAGDYNVYAGLSHGEQNANQLSASLATVAGDVTTTNQTATVVGTFSGTGTGGWGSNDLIPLMNGGSLATVSLSGAQTVRFNLGSGDYDFLLFYKTGGGGAGERIAYSVAGGQITVTAPAGYSLEKSTAVTGGTWTTVAGPGGSHTESIGTGTAYFRGKQ